MDWIWLIPIIGIPICGLGLFIASHDSIAMSINAEKSLESNANTTKDCFNLRLMTMNHEDDWFPDKYVTIAKHRMIDLKC